jgi:energy-coupling factor transporter ATP-binding protein EcfA2
MESRNDEDGMKAALVERTRELDALESARERAASGHGEVVVIEGPAGIGKSRLVEALVQVAGPSEALLARGGVLEQEIPFGVARQLLERRVFRASGCGRGELLAGPAARAEEVLGIRRETDRLDSLSTPNDLGASIHCLFWVLLNVAERTPLVVAVDDAHWADLPSLHFLVYLARRIEDMPVLLVAAARDREGGPQEAVLGELCASGQSSDSLPSLFPVWPSSSSAGSALALAPSSRRRVGQPRVAIRFCLSSCSGRPRQSPTTATP